MIQVQDSKQVSKIEDIKIEDIKIQDSEIQDSEKPEVVLSVRGLRKFFGINRSAARKMLQEGAGKSEILKKTGVTVAVDGVSFDVERGKIFALIGLSGSGKSTVVRCINMLQRPTSGQIFFEGRDVVHMNKQELHELRRSKISMVFQSFGLMSHRDVMGNVAYGLDVRGIGKEERERKAMEMIELVGLAGWERRAIGDLSGGMKQRVGIARALCNDPDLLLMDEPFSALDPLARRDMQFELLSIQKKLGKTVVFITHDINEAFKMGDTVGIMRDGRIEQLGTPTDLTLFPANDYVKDFLGSIDKTKVLSVRHIMITPSCLIREQADPVTAIREMSENDVSTAYVIGRKMEFVGVVTLTNALQARHDNLPSVASVLTRDVPSVDQDALISDIIGTASDTPFPLAVLDDGGRLEGIVSRAAILSSLS
ncbi:MAG: betaine/proline/choline family ABC transporter ATP-binding protein [Synergistaceae bacterium]|jgi:glycine betaine/proline transport system ATP-binding protein|nr:betaine/proline/choline family ABC transporter ATP-binding protein [Synergistaceae bacterium]